MLFVAVMKNPASGGNEHLSLLERTGARWEIRESQSPRGGHQQPPLRLLLQKEVGSWGRGRTVGGRGPSPAAASHTRLIASAWPRSTEEPCEAAAGLISFPSWSPKGITGLGGCRDDQTSDSSPCNLVRTRGEKKTWSCLIQVLKWVEQ